LKMPQGALSTILHRTCKLGYVEKRRGIYRRNTAKLDSLNLGSVRSRVKRQQSALLNELAEFATEGYDVNWGASEAERALLSYLSTRGTAILTAAVDGRAIDSTPPVDNSGVLSTPLSPRLLSQSQVHSSSSSLGQGKHVGRCPLSAWYFRWR
jgi:hypothetical protein